MLRSVAFLRKLWKLRAIFRIACKVARLGYFAPQSASLLLLEIVCYAWYEKNSSIAVDLSFRVLQGKSRWPLYKSRVEPSTLQYNKLTQWVHAIQQCAHCTYRTCHALHVVVLVGCALRVLYHVYPCTCAHSFGRMKDTMNDHTGYNGHMYVFLLHIVLESMMTVCSLIAWPDR